MSVTHRIAAALLAAGATLVSLPATAAYDCSVAVVAVAFGDYNPVAALPDDSAGRVDVTCSNVAGTGADSVSYTVALSPGASGGYAPRRLGAGNERLNYNLFRDAGRTQVWGNGSGGSYLVGGSMRVGPGVGNRTRTNTHDIFGRVPAQQDVAVGAYSDAIFVTVSF
jgi:spore coat protein U-like protein